MADVLSSLYMYICIHLYTYFQILNINLSEKQRSYFIFLSSLKFLLYYIKFEGKGEGGGGLHLPIASSLASKLVKNVYPKKN